MELGNVKLHIDSGEVVIDGIRKKLTQKETQLLEILLKNPRMVLSKEMLLDRVWGVDGNAMENSVEIYTHYLRKKLDPSNLVIETIRGIGYVLKERNHVK